MPRAGNTTQVPKGTQGRTTVMYVTTRGREFPAEVTGGTWPNLNLRVRGLAPRGAKTATVKTAVAQRTAMAQSNVWYSAL